MLAALLSGIPTIAFEPNAAPGLANRLVGEFVSAAAVNFQQSSRYFHAPEVTGIPVRPEFFAIAPKLRGAGRLLVFGGSQGARVLNEVMPSVARRLIERYPDMTIVHQAGGRHAESTQSAFAAAGVRRGRVLIVPYLDRMVAEIAAADVILCRSGASTVAELAAAGRPALLVPFAAAADDHQRKNAEVLVDAGAARWIDEKELAPEKVFSALCALLDDPLLRLRMGTAARSLAHADAAGRIAEMCVRLAKPPRKGR
jgi:UDP-N-acetylglucosamine--N-acetylmuramyl-(pentapeptide) pyrophosphoryl-undecaprenol N-acetylglucosamine transferase